MKVTIFFKNDPTVGLNSEYFQMTIPDNNLNDFREEVRKEIQKMYMQLDGEFTPEVIFEDEKQ